MDEGWMRFVRKRHSRFSATKEQLDEIFSRAGISASGLRRIVEGGDNEVYEILGQNLILRISRGDCSFIDEMWAMEKARKAGLPVPEVKYYGIHDIDGKREVMIMEKAKGKPLPERPSNALLFNLGKHLKNLHSIKVEGFYKRRNGKWKIDSWERLLGNAYKARKRERKFITKVVDENTFEKSLEMIKQYREEYPDEEAVLNHGDICLEHVFHEGQEITAFIDFCDFEGNSWIHDIAYFHMEFPYIDIEPVFKGHGREDWKQFKFHAVMIALGHIAYSVKIGNLENGKKLGRWLEEVVR